MRNSVLTTLIIILSFQYLQSQPSYADLRFEDYIYVDHIRTVQVSNPYLRLQGNASTSTLLSFDDLKADMYPYQYTMILCNKDWTPADVETTYYLNGFEYDEIEDVSPSSRTNVSYSHHRLEFPNRNMEITASGNYLLVVFDEQNNPILSRRFVVHEGSGLLTGVITSPFQNQFRPNYQQVNVDYKKSPAEIHTIPDSINLYCMQNGNWQTLQKLPQIISINEKGMQTDLTKYATFLSVNDFRKFDTSNETQRGIGVNSVVVTRDSSYAILDLQNPRRDDEFSREFDMDGDFEISLIDGRGNNDRRVDSEYIYTVFTLEVKEKWEDPIYIVGRFSDFMPYPEYKMHYYEKQSAYVCIVPMKQGIYNYLFATITDGELNYKLTEKLDFEANHTYQALAYFRSPADRHDRLLTVGAFKERQ